MNIGKELLQNHGAALLAPRVPCPVVAFFNGHDIAIARDVIDDQMPARRHNNTNFRARGLRWDQRPPGHLPRKVRRRRRVDHGPQRRVHTICANNPIIVRSATVRTYQRARGIRTTDRRIKMERAAPLTGRPIQDRDQIPA